MIENEMTVSVPLEVVKASEIEPKEVKWLWYPYIPVGKVTLLQGDPGDGKSKLMLSIAALLSKGEPLPFTETEENEPMTIIYQTTEDDADDTVVPRFNSAGGNGENLIFIKEDEKSLSFGDNRIREAIEMYHATYENMNVIEERIPYNVHFKKPFAPTYMEQLKQMETDGMVSLRGLRKDATLFNEIVIDVNTMYFERNGGYEYAKQFYEEAFHFIEEKFGADNVISAVMHADEINVAATEELGKEVYHYHLHAMVLPVVEKEILWSKRCKDEKLRGTVKEVVHQISHSKKWKSDIPLTDEKGNPLLRKNGKPMFRASYSILQDELFNHMTEQGFKGFQRGEYGSTAEHLTSLQYQIKQDKERLEKLQKRIQREQIKYEPARNVSKTYNEIDRMGQKTITGKMAISKEDYSELTALAKEGITSRAEISELEQSANYYRQKYFDCANALERMKTKYNELKEKCRPFLQALEHFPEVAKLFTEKVKQLFSFKEAQERAEKEAREKERQERIKARRNKRGMER